MKYKHKICQFRLYFCETKLLAYFHIHYEWSSAVASSFKLRHSYCLCLLDLKNYFYFQLWWHSPVPEAQFHHLWVTDYATQDYYTEGQHWSINKGKSPPGDYCQKIQISSSNIKKKNNPSKPNSPQMSIQPGKPSICALTVSSALSTKPVCFLWQVRSV